MAKSRAIIDLLIQNLKLYLNDSSIVFERFRQSPGDVENRGELRKARVAIYEQSERNLIEVDAFKSFYAETTFGIDINYRRAYQNDDASRGELPLLDIRDRIYDWSQQLDAGLVTECRILAFGYNGSAGITRNPNFVTLTMNFKARKDSFQNQT